MAKVICIGGPCDGERLETFGNDMVRFRPKVDPFCDWRSVLKPEDRVPFDPMDTFKAPGYDEIRISDNDFKYKLVRCRDKFRLVPEDMSIDTVFEILYIDPIRKQRKS